MKAPARRSVCPIACTLDVLGDKWSLLIVRDLFAGKTHYREFAASPEKIATNILADRLERMIAMGLISAAPSPQRAGSHAYHLTEKGRSLYPVLVSIRDWGLAHVPGTRAHIAVTAPDSPGKPFQTANARKEHRS